ncbi:MAG: tripartite tricarboxylate transporter substrate binding protein [Burkholderiales bacterium]|nr:tripartite tricarboxylate transporter substrate binding protein [Burkholderiales bacterium]
MNITRRAAVVLAAGCAAAPLRAQQGGWPHKPLRISVVYPPGGVSDAIARELALRMAAPLGVAVLVDNRAGDGGSLGMQALARSDADGHSLAFSAVSPLTLKPHLERVTADPLKQFAPVAAVMYTPVLLVGTPGFSGASFGDLLAQARNHPGALRWATSGVATAGHNVLEQVRLGAKVDITHVPYKGGGQQIYDALSGEFELLSTNVAAQQLQLVREGRFKALAVGAPARLSVLPDVPTFAELGLPAANVSSLFGLFAPAGTPDDRITRLNGIVNEVIAQPGFQERLRAADNLPAGGSAAWFAREIRAQWSANRRLGRLN